jgi:hypothetical protein
MLPATLNRHKIPVGMKMYQEIQEENSFKEEDEHRAYG